MPGLVERAARNNALWCDAVCRAQGRGGTFAETLWVNRLGSPPYYPAAVTLAGTEAAVHQRQAVADLSREPALQGFAVKDSFHCLDLEPLGFSPLFDAEWLWRPAPAEAGAASWARAVVPADLLAWERAWSGEAVEAADALFRPGLLADPDVAFLSTEVDGAPLGGVLNRGGAAVGLSNLFGPADAMDRLWRALAEQAALLFPGLPLAAYETEDTQAPALRAGFAAIGPLRVWNREA